jgi:hypothetical protein
VKRLIAALAALTALAWPALAQACAVCGLAAERNRLAFLATTILLSLLPLGMIAGGVLYLKRVARERLIGEFAEPDDALEALAIAAAQEPTSAS